MRKDHNQWLKERDEAVYSFDVETFKRFYNKWLKLGIYTDPLPDDRIIEIAMRKMVVGLASPRRDKLKEAVAWLSERGYSPFI